MRIMRLSPGPAPVSDFCSELFCCLWSGSRAVMPSHYRPSFPKALTQQRAALAEAAKSLETLLGSALEQSIMSLPEWDGGSVIRAASIRSCSENIDQEVKCAYSKSLNLKKSRWIRRRRSRDGVAVS